MKEIPDMKPKGLLAVQSAPAFICELGLLAISIVLPSIATAESNDAPGHAKVQHVLLVSVDGMHQSDLAWYRPS